VLVEQAVPVAGAVLNASVNAGLVNQTFRRAEAVYRLRFLSAKCGIDPAEWRREFPIGSDEVEHVVQVDEELEAEIERGQGSESAQATHSTASGTVRRLTPNRHSSWTGRAESVLIPLGVVGR
jgi:hypothetical protein